MDTESLHIEVPRIVQLKHRLDAQRVSPKESAGGLRGHTMCASNDEVSSAIVQEKLPGV
jgi:hypothetical protein